MAPRRKLRSSAPAKNRPRPPADGSMEEPEQVADEEPEVEPEPATPPKGRSPSKRPRRLTSSERSGASESVSPTRRSTRRRAGTMDDVIHESHDEPVVAVDEQMEIGNEEEKPKMPKNSRRLLCPDTGRTESLSPRRRGRQPNTTNAELTELALADDEAAQQLQEVQSPEKAESVSPTRRSGRRQQNQESTGAPATVIPGNLDEAAGPETDVETSRSKPRGRLARIKQEVSELPEEVPEGQQLDEVGSEEMEPASTAPKRRGRPPRKAAESAEDTEPATRRNGRTSRSRSSTSGVKATATVPTTRRSARLKDTEEPASEEHDEDAGQAGEDEHAEEADQPGPSSAPVQQDEEDDEDEEDDDDPLDLDEQCMARVMAKYPGRTRKQVVTALKALRAKSRAAANAAWRPPNVTREQMAEPSFQRWFMKEMFNATICLPLPCDHNRHRHYIALQRHAIQCNLPEGEECQYKECALTKDMMKHWRTCVNGCFICNEPHQAHVLRLDENNYPPPEDVMGLAGRDAPLDQDPNGQRKVEKPWHRPHGPGVRNNVVYGYTKVIFPPNPQIQHKYVIEEAKLAWAEEEAIYRTADTLEQYKEMVQPRMDALAARFEERWASMDPPMDKTPFQRTVKDDEFPYRWQQRYFTSLRHSLYRTYCRDLFPDLVEPSFNHPQIRPYYLWAQRAERSVFYACSSYDEYWPKVQDIYARQIQRLQAMWEENRKNAWKRGVSEADRKRIVDDVIRDGIANGVPWDGEFAMYHRRDGYAYEQRVWDTAASKEEYQQTVLDYLTGRSTNETGTSQDHLHEPDGMLEDLANLSPEDRLKALEAKLARVKKMRAEIKAATDARMAKIEELNKRAAMRAQVSPSLGGAQAAQTSSQASPGLAQVQGVQAEQARQRPQASAGPDQTQRVREVSQVSPSPAHDQGVQARPQASPSSAPAPQARPAQPQAEPARPKTSKSLAEAVKRELKSSADAQDEVEIKDEAIERQAQAVQRKRRAQVDDHQAQAEPGKSISGKINKAGLSSSSGPDDFKPVKPEKLVYQKYVAPQKMAKNLAAIHDQPGPSRMGTKLEEFDRKPEMERDEVELPENSDSEGEEPEEAVSAKKSKKAL